MDMCIDVSRKKRQLVGWLVGMVILNSYSLFVLHSHMRVMRARTCVRYVEKHGDCRWIQDGNILLLMFVYTLQKTINNATQLCLRLIFYFFFLLSNLILQHYNWVDNESKIYHEAQMLVILVTSYKRPCIGHLREAVAVGEI